MIQKIIHNIWLQGYDNLPNTIKIQHNNIKKLNPEWEFTVWDNNMIEKLLKKYPINNIEDLETNISMNILAITTNVKCPIY